MFCFTVSASLTYINRGSCGDIDFCDLARVWGMTELSCVASMFYYPEDDDTGSIGRIIPNCEAK